MVLSNGNHKRGNNSNKQDILTEEQQEVLRTKMNKIEKLRTEITQMAKPLSTKQFGEDTHWSTLITPKTLSIFQDEKSWAGISRTVMMKSEHSANGIKNLTDMSWGSLRETIQSYSEDDISSESRATSPTTTRLDSEEMDVFGLMPMKDNRVIIKCKSCQRPILPSKFKQHIENCIGQIESSSIANNLSEEEDDTLKVKKHTKKYKKKGTTLTAADDDDTNSFSDSSKVPLTTSSDKTAGTLERAKKMKKEKTTKKTARQKAPLDLDRQCGVIQGPNNLPCTRSLTCKSHSMGAKRAVEGRSQPYDVLLATYQKKSIGRPNAKDRKGTPTSIGSGTTAVSTAGKTVTTIKSHKRLQTSQSVYGNNSQNKAKNGMLQGSATQTDEPFIDSDEEVENVMQAIRLSRPTPLAQRSFHFVKRKRQCFRLRDILLDAITPKSESTVPTGESIGNGNGTMYMNNDSNGVDNNLSLSTAAEDVMPPQFTVQSQHRQPPPDFLYNYQNRSYTNPSGIVDSNLYINPQ